MKIFIRLCAFVFLFLVGAASAEEPEGCDQALVGRVSFFYSSDSDVQYHSNYLERLSHFLNDEIISDRANVFLGPFEELFELLSRAGLHRFNVRHAKELFEEVTEKISALPANQPHEIRKVMDSLTEDGKSGDPVIFCLLSRRCDMVSNSSTFSATVPRFRIIDFPLSQKTISVETEDSPESIDPVGYFRTIILNTKKLNSIQFAANVLSQSSQGMAMKRLFGWLEANLTLKEKGLPVDRLFQRYARFLENNEVVINEGFVRVYTEAMAAQVQRELFTLLLVSRDAQKIKEIEKITQEMAYNNILQYPSALQEKVHLNLKPKNVFGYLDRWTRVIEGTIEKSRGDGGRRSSWRFW